MFWFESNFSKSKVIFIGLLLIITFGLFTFFLSLFFIIVLTLVIVVSINLVLSVKIQFDIGTDLMHVELSRRSIIICIRKTVVLIDLAARLSFTSLHMSPRHLVGSTSWILHLNGSALSSTLVVAREQTDEARSAYDHYAQYDNPISPCATLISITLMILIRVCCLCGVAREHV